MTSPLDRATAALAGLVLLAAPALAQDTETPLHLGRIIIGYSADGTPVYAGENSSTLEGDAITGHGGIVTLDEVVRQTPGVSTLMNAGQAGVAVAIRGLGGSRVDTSIEGVPQNFRFTAHNTADGFAYVDPLLLSAIDITRGASLSDGGLTGSVNFRMISAADLVRDGEGTGGMVRLRYGDNGQGFAGMAAVGMVRGPLELAFAATSRNLDAYVNGAGTEVGDTAQKGGSLMLRGAYQVSDALKVNFLAMTYDTSYSSAYKMSFAPGMPPVTLAAYDHKVSNDIYSLGFTYSTGDLINLTGNLYSGTTTHRHVSGFGSALGRVMETETLGLDVKNVSTAALGNWTLTSTNGFEISRDQLGGQQNASGSLTGVNPVRGDTDRAAVFSENTFTNGPFEVMLGFRYSDYDLDTTVGAETYKVSHSSFDPRLSLAYSINDNFQPYVSVSRSTRAPTAQETFLGGGDPSVHGFGYVGNLALEPEVSEGYEIGVNITRDDIFRADDSLKARINYFDLDVDNFIIAQTNAGGAGMQFVNIDETVRTRGLELELGYESDRFSAILAWAHSKGSYGGGRLQPENAISATLAGHFLDGALTLGTTLVYNSNGPAAIAFETETNRGSYKTIDIFASYDVAENFSLNAKVSNITDELYTPWAATDSSGPGRSAYIGGEIRF